MHGNRQVAGNVARYGIESRERLGKWRWVVERSLGCMYRFRRLRIRSERRADIHQAFLSLGCIPICWRYIHGFTGFVSRAKARALPVHWRQRLLADDHSIFRSLSLRCR